MLNSIVGLLSAGGGAANSYESIATVTVGAGGSSVITFSSIPSTYKHLQIRCMSRSDALCFAYLAFNSDTTNANYKTHYLMGNGSAASAGAYNQTYPGMIYGGAAGFGQAPNVSAQIFDILDYASTNKNKTIRMLNGLDANGSGVVGLDSAVWLNNSSAVSTITLSTNTSVFSQYSSFALYGIKG